MTKENILDALNSIDSDMVEDAELKIPNTNKKWIKWSAAAASLAAALALCWGMWGMYRQTAPINPPQNNPPIISYVTGGQALTGKQEIVIGNTEEDPSGLMDILTPDFYSHIVLEVQVLEVLPDTYCDLNEQYFYNQTKKNTVHVAKLRVLDQVNAKDFPNEIWLQYDNYDTLIFNGYDSFVISVEQVGVENYMLVNQSQKRMDYFSDMFRIYVGDLGYGSVIAFRDGRVAGDFWDKTMAQCPDKVFKAPGADFYLKGDNCYPASAGSTVRKVKESILAEDTRLSECDGSYITAEDIFCDEESRALKEYVSPESGNSFVQYLDDDTDPSARYIRVVNGFLTDEIIVIGNGVTREGVVYTEENLENMPDIGNALDQMNLAQLVPPHIEVEEDMLLRYAAAFGTYRKVNGRIYGIVKVVWCYCLAETAEYGWIDECIMDDCYYLYEAQCNSRVVERDELRRIIGDDLLILEFPYDWVTVIY